jgi:hypothetical protein
MPVAPVSKTLQTAGDTAQLALGYTGVGNPPDQTVVVSLTGTFTNAVVAIEGIPLGQASTSVPMPISEVSTLTGSTVSSPVGPLTSSGNAGSGFSFTVNAMLFSVVQIRLVSIGSGAITSGIASQTFPVTLTPASTSFFDLARQGKVYTGSTPAAGVTLPVYSSTTQQAVLFNPASSNVRLCLKSVRVGYVSGTMSAGYLVYGVQTNSANTITGTSSTLVNNNLLGGSSATGVVYTAATVTAFSFFRPIKTSVVAEAATATNNPFDIYDDIGGTIVLSPGYALSVATSVSESIVTAVAFEWAELPLYS